MSHLRYFLLFIIAALLMACDRGKSLSDNTVAPVQPQLIPTPTVTPNVAPTTSPTPPPSNPQMTCTARAARSMLTVAVNASGVPTAPFPQTDVLVIANLPSRVSVGAYPLSLTVTTNHVITLTSFGLGENLFILRVVDETDARNIGVCSIVLTVQGTATPTPTPPPLPQVSLTANGQLGKTFVLVGNVVTIGWQYTNADTCVASWTTAAVSPGIGSMVFGPVNFPGQLFTLVCSGGGGSANASVEVSALAIQPWVLFGEKDVVRTINLSPALLGGIGAGPTLGQWQVQPRIPGQGVLEPNTTATEDYQYCPAGKIAVGMSTEGNDHLLCRPLNNQWKTTGAYDKAPYRWTFDSRDECNGPTIVVDHVCTATQCTLRCAYLVAK